MKQTSVGFKVGVVTGIVHLCLVLLAYFVCTESKSSTAGLIYIPFFILDAPLLLIAFSTSRVFGDMMPLIVFGIFGSVMWFLIPWLTDKAFHHIFPKPKTLVRIIVILLCIPLLLMGFSLLSTIGIRQNIRQERPAELKKRLNRASSDFLTEKVVFRDRTERSISNITRIQDKSGGQKLIAGVFNGVVFFDNHYQEQSRLIFSQSGFSTLTPLIMDESGALRFLAYSYGKGIYLFDTEEKEVWSITQPDPTTGHIDGACFGDLDGNGKQEFAIYYRYRKGICLVDSDGKNLWEHPVYALGHVEIADLNGDGREEMIYDNSNNAGGVTEFVTLDAAGTIVSREKFKTRSYEFEVIQWPNPQAEPSILLTEDNILRTVDLKGNTILLLEAPGCRPFGDVKAVTVRFDKNQPAYLAVRKKLHPDITVLYVYDHQGKLVYQKTDVTDYAYVSALAVADTDIPGQEKLLAGYKNEIREYLPAQRMPIEGSVSKP